MKRKDILDAVLLFLGPLFRLLAGWLESRHPNAAQFCRCMGTTSDIVNAVVRT